MDTKDNIRERIQKILDENVNAQLAAHGGSASLTEYEDGVAWIKFHGACASCMSSSETLENIVKESICREIPEVRELRLDDSVSEDLLDMARKILSGELKD